MIFSKFLSSFKIVFNGFIVIFSLVSKLKFELTKSPLTKIIWLCWKFFNIHSLLYWEVFSWLGNYSLFRLLYSIVFKSVYFQFSSFLDGKPLFWKILKLLILILSRSLPLWLTFWNASKFKLIILLLTCSLPFLHSQFCQVLKLIRYIMFFLFLH